jgi:uncharacterized protein
MTEQSETPSKDVDPKLLEVLVCPVTRGPLVYDRKANELVSKSARLAYPIREGVPIMLPDEARELSDKDAK